MFNVDFVFDFVFFNVYFSYQVIFVIEECMGGKFNYILCLLGGIFKVIGNQVLMFVFVGIKGKFEYDCLEIEWFINKYDIVFIMNFYFLVNIFFIV